MKGILGKIAARPPGLIAEIYRAMEPRRHLRTTPISGSGGSMTKRAAIAIATMIGATVLAHYGLAQQPGAGGRTEQSKQGKGRGGFAPSEAGSDLSKPPLPKDDGEKKILEAIDNARQGRRYANVSTADGRLLRQLTEAVNAKRVVELGTSTGESGLWFAMALRKTGGHLYTHDIDPGRISVARENFKRGGVENLITIVEGNAHQTATKNTDPID